MKYASVCAGICAATVAWKPLGFEPVFFSEFDPEGGDSQFPARLLAHHYPRIPNRGDLTRFAEWPDADFDVLVGGTPCQGFSIAGKREGMADPRSALAWSFLEVARRYRPRWVLWENVPGVLSADSGADFHAFLTRLGEFGYGWAYRILDAQFFGVAQRRRRVFVVGCLGGWAASAAVLFERPCLSWDSAPCRASGENPAPTLADGSNGGGANGPGRTVDSAESLQVVDTLRSHPFPGSNALGAIVPQISNAITGREQKGQASNASQGTPLIVHTLRGEVFDASEDGSMRGTPLIPVGFNARQDHDAWLDRCGPLDTDPSTQAVCVPPQVFQQRFARNDRGAPDDICPALTSEPGGTGKGDSAPCTFGASGVRRLTPRECERLQGFPDDYTLIPGAKDSPRYKAIGNSMAVPVMRWLGEGIALVDEVLEEESMRAFWISQGAT